MRLCLLDLDGSLLDQPALTQWRGTTVTVLLQDLESGLRLWADAASLDLFRQRLDAQLPQHPAHPGADGGPDVFFMGSGDFHHLAAVLIERAATPLSVVHFDNHPDWVRFPPRWHCGSWVNRVLDMPQIARVVTLGPCSDDLSWPQLKGANMAALETGRLHLYPWRHPPSQMVGRPDHLWDNLADHNDWPRKLDQIVTDLPTQSVWISIDKDVLAPPDALTNWDQGQMPLTALLSAMAVIAARRTIVGIDVCGEYSPPRFSSILKRLSAWMDHPAAPDAGQTARNNVTNARLLATIAEHVA